MKGNYVDYATIAKVETQIENYRQQLRGDYFYLSPEVRDLENQVKKLVMGEMIEVKDKECREPHCANTRVCYPGIVHHLDGDISNESFGNLAMVCPKCQTHILLSRFAPEDIWLLKVRGLSNAEVGRILGLSRERVRQLCERYEAQKSAELAKLMETDPNDLVKRAEYIEDRLIWRRSLKRRIDRRTKKKRIIAELDKLRGQTQRGDTK